MVVLEDNNCCEHCGESFLDIRYENITIRNGKVYHTECLSENLE